MLGEGTEFRYPLSDLVALTKDFSRKVISPNLSHQRIDDNFSPSISLLTTCLARDVLGAYVLGLS